MPRCRGSEPSLHAVEVPFEVGVGSETILLVEDDPGLVRLTARLLVSQGYTVLTATDAAEALGLARAHPGPIDLLLSDVVMPDMNGRELAGALASVRPGIRHLFMSGHTADVIAHRGILAHDVPFIEKPFSVAALSEKVREVLDSAEGFVASAGARGHCSGS